MTLKACASKAGTEHNLALRKQSLAHSLLIELLSYQFASPVRWIETQNAFLDTENEVQRYVEIGPASVLAAMAKKSASKWYCSEPTSRWSRLKFLAYNNNKDDIYYGYSDQPSKPQSDSISEAALSAVENRKSSNPAIDSQVLSAPKIVTGLLPAIDESSKSYVDSGVLGVAAAGAVPLKAAKVVALTAAHVTTSLTAQRLKQAFDNVSQRRTIRELSGGKSTLQNELIGDLGAEFGNLPSGAEDMTLEDLGDTVQRSFSGKPGKQMSASISRFISSKMPAGFNQGAILDHLHTRWGMNHEHSVVPLCLAVTIEPPARLSNLEAAREFFDSLMPRYASHVGTTLISNNDRDGPTRPTALMVDSTGLEAVRSEQRDFHSKQLQLLVKHLKYENPTHEDKIAELETSLEHLDARLHQWDSEFDEYFFNGIQSLFDIRQGRSYDSWWNWVREDLVRLLCETSSETKKMNMLEYDDRLTRILNKWDSTCLDLVRGLITCSTNQPFLVSEQVLQDFYRLGSSALEVDPVFKYTLPTMRPKTTISPAGEVQYSEESRKLLRYSSNLRKTGSPFREEQLPLVHLRKRSSSQEWIYDQDSTKTFLETVEAATTLGITFANKSVLVTGAGQNSIGAEIVKGLLSGGARVVVTTSRVVSSTASFYQAIYRTFGARGSSLTVLPFNQSSKKDCEALIKHIYSVESPVAGHLDYIVPFAAIQETGEIDSLDGKSELSHRAMLVNVLRLLGCVRQEKEQRSVSTRPTNVILPLSPNHGIFGGDGLYAESKLGLETLFNRFHSESWSNYLTISGAVIGWTRGTGLMSQNNIVAQAIEQHGVFTFSQSEMALNILALMTPAISALAEDDPIYADFSGGLQSLSGLKEKIATARRHISDESELKRLLTFEAGREKAMLGKLAQARPEVIDRSAIQRAYLTLGFPDLPRYDILANGLHDLVDMVDLSRVAVVVGFSELGPWGSARTRWEMEHKGHFTMEGYVELAWIMGLVKHSTKEVINGETYVGWLDAKTNEPVLDHQFEERYHDTITTHTGLRFIEPEGLGGYDPARKEILHEIAIEEDLPPFESSKAVADAFKLRHGENVTIQAIPGSDTCRIKLKKGACFLVPKAISFDRTVAGQLPKGWDPLRYGIPEDIIQQVDPITLYALCCVSEALLSATITDPFEFFKHIHVSELLNCIGTGGGALLAARGVYKDRYLDKQVQSDILQESFLNTVGAWVNMLLLSSTGPIQTPVGACATAFESLNIGCEAIHSGRSKVAIVGACDDFQEELSYEFGKMKATASSIDELAKGRLPAEMSRPSTTSRNGFVESAGCGVQIVMSAELALEMGLPIYGIVAHTQIASDRIGRSVPAPGKGILSAARETRLASSSNLLDLGYRRKKLAESVQASLNQQRNWSDDTIAGVDVATLKQAQRMWSNDIRLLDPAIAPMRAALATWGLTIDDIEVASMHGTSTKANDTNEADVINQQMTHLGRRKGNPLLVVCQKSLTGHPKGGAGAWQLNGCLQMMQSKIVPGNKNADNIDSELRVNEHLVYPMDAMKKAEVKATMATSFGFGQKGAVAIVIAPKYVLAAVTKDEYNDYQARTTKRQQVANTTLQHGIMHNSLFKAKDKAPWGPGDAAMKKVLLDPDCRVSHDGSNVSTDNGRAPLNGKPRLTTRTSSYQNNMMTVSETGLLTGNVQNMLERNLSTRNTITSVGVDVESIKNINLDNAIFLERNFSLAERQYCYNSPNPAASFAGRWSAKEAVFKSLQVSSEGPGAAMKDIEIVTDSGVPKVQLHGKPKDVAAARGISEINISITHGDDTVTAIALANRV